MKKWILKPQYNVKDETSTLISYDNTKCFSLEEIKTDKSKTYENNSFSVLLCLEGSGSISDSEKTLNVMKGDQIFIPAGEKQFSVIPNKNETVRLIRCLPPA